MREKVKPYLPALLKFNELVAGFKLMIPIVVKLPPIDRANYFNDGYDSLLRGLYHRPKKIPFGVVRAIDELKAFCDAVTVGWRLWPDYSTGLYMMIDYLAEDTRIDDIKRIEPTFLLTLKEIASNEAWNNFMAAQILPSQAKKILIRFKKATNTVENEGKAVGQLDNLEKDLVSMMLGLKMRPEYGKNKICDGLDCVEIELTPGEFPHCGKCKQAVYHSKECQVKAWKAGHKKACKKQTE